MHRLALCAAFCFLVPARAAEFMGAAEPAATPISPVIPAEQRARFTLPPGFEIELVASEDQGAGKPITVAWDDSARLWTMTALEYPLDGNEQPEAAKALYAKGGRDRVLVFDDPYSGAPRMPRVFADGLAMPMGILPYKDGALVGHGPEVLFLRDTDGDGMADKREVLLSGFGIQDSHLMPHQFTRAPGGWFYLAQGAFNYSRVKTRGGRELKFDQTRLARFTADGMQFEDLTSGPCNIWGLVMGREGEVFIQEANDYGYPVMAFHAGASYPGCSGTFKPYAPFFPSEVEFRMGGTGLSGLAMSDPAASFPGAYAEVMYVANPITRKIQAIKIHREGPHYRYEKLPDFVLSSDEWFRPVAIQFGPDGCLYIVDWYNKIISHNEVPRAHPERDKTRGRIWRVRHKTQSRLAPPNIASANEGNLLRHLQSESSWQMRAASHQIIDRDLRGIAPELKIIAENMQLKPEHRLQAFWTLEELRALSLATVRSLLGEPNRNLRREALRSLSTLKPPASAVFPILTAHAEDSDPEVRAETIRVARLYLNQPGAIPFLASMSKPSLPGPLGKNPQNGAPMKIREAYDRDFERYLIRAALEENPAPLKNFLGSSATNHLSTEAQLLFALALPPAESGDRIAAFLRKIDRAPNEEELLRLTENLANPESVQTLTALLAKPDARRLVFDALLKVRNRIDTAKLAPLFTEPVQALWSAGDHEYAARVAGAFKIAPLAPAMDQALLQSPEPVQLALLRSLRELDGASTNSLAQLAREGKSRAVQDEALNSLVATKKGTSGLLIDLWPQMNAVQRRSALRSLTASDTPAKLLTSALAKQDIHERELDAETVDKLRALFPKDTNVQSLVERLSTQFQPVLRLDGKIGSYVDSNIDLEGPFTVETWIRLEPGIGNEDGLLGQPGAADFNFAGGHFRAYTGRETGDRVIARKPMVANAWTHLAVSRDAEGVFRLFINGELDGVDERRMTAPLKGLDLGRTSPNSGTLGEFTEYRVWNRARTGEEIRADFDRAFAGEPLPSGLVHYFSGAGPWGTLQGGARVEKISDGPALLTAAQAREQAARFAHFRNLAAQDGDLEKGRILFASACAVCHSVGGQGGQIGPVLNGAGASGAETMLRALLTPNAAMEAGYRNYRVELKDGDILNGFFISEDDSAIVLRQPNIQDQRIAKDKVRRAEFTRQSLMPEGLLDALHPEDVRNLFAFLKSLK